MRYTSIDENRISSARLDGYSIAALHGYVRVLGEVRLRSLAAKLRSSSLAST
jgi:hypothetical protein